MKNNAKRTKFKVSDTKIEFFCTHSHSDTTTPPAPATHTHTHRLWRIPTRGPVKYISDLKLLITSLGQEGGGC